MATPRSFTTLLRTIACLSLAAAPAAIVHSAPAGSRHTLAVVGAELQLDGTPIKLKGLRTSAALMADATLDPTHAARLGRIIEAADIRGMVVLVGCLYWSTSRAHEDLAHWTQNDAERAVANTVAWLKERQEAHHSSAPLFTRCSICGHFVLSRSSAVRGAPRE